MQRTKYTPEAKAEALRLLAEVGLGEASRRTSIPSGTIASWGNRNGVTAPPTEERERLAVQAQVGWQQRRVALGEHLGTLALKAAQRVEERLEGDRTGGIRDLVVTLGVLVDKAQLLTGGATARTETVVERTPEAEAEVAKVLTIARAA